MRSSTGNGGVSASLSTPGAAAAPGTSRVGSASLTVPSGRCRTFPVTRTTYSLRTRWTSAPTSSPGSTTTCRMPATSRTSRNTTPPWSRRPSTHPQTTTSRSMSVVRRSPARSVRIIAWCHLHLGVRSLEVALESFLQPARDPLARPFELFVRLHVAHTHRTVLRFTRAEQHREPSARAVGDLHLRLERTTVVGAFGPHAVFAQLGDQQRDLGRVVEPVDHEHVGRGFGAGDDALGRAR